MESDSPKTFSVPLTVRTEDIDEMDHVNNVVYIRWVQEVAEAHWLSVAGTEMRQRYQWVVLRHEIDYKNPVLPGDVITGTTWVGTHHGARFERFVRLQDTGRSRIYAEAKTIWCLLEGKTKKPLRIPDEVLALL